MKTQPSDISTQGHFWDSFGHVETEVSANYIVQFCQERGSWAPFTFEEINAFYQKVREDFSSNFTFNELVDPGVGFSIQGGRYQKGGGWITKDRDGKFHITDDFILRCYKASPAKQKRRSRG